jgi:hypothetical protein
MSEIILQPIKEKEAEKLNTHPEAHFKEHIHSIAILDNQIIVIGQPPSEYIDEDESTHHNCDAMGCGWEHVLMRINVDKVIDFYTDIPRVKKVSSRY